MSHYQVDIDGIAEAAARIAGSAGTIRGEVSAMLAHLPGLEARWTGGASHAFADLVAQWRAAQAQLEQALDTIATGLSHAATEYETAEASAARFFTR